MLLLLIILPSSIVSAQDQTQVLDGVVEFDQYDFSKFMRNNQTEQVLLWSNSTPVFENGRDQLTFSYTIKQSKFPLSVAIVFTTKDNPYSSNSSSPDGFSIWISTTLTLRNLLEDSTVVITVNWKTMLNETQELDNHNYDSTYDMLRRDYQIFLFLSGSHPIWSDYASIQYSASSSSRTKDVGDQGFVVDVSHAKFKQDPVSDTITTRNLVWYSGYVSILILPVLLKKRRNQL